MGKRTWISVAVVLLAVATAACGDEDDERSLEVQARDTATSVQQRADAATRFTATLSSGAEVPGPGDPDGTGFATVNVDATGGRVCYEVAVQKIDTPTAMHIHRGEAGKAGPPVVSLKPPASGDTSISDCAQPDDRAEIGRITANPGGFYVNVHTSTYPDGAVRGQLTQ